MGVGKMYMFIRDVYYLSYMHVKFALHYSFFEEKVIWVLILFIKGNFWVNYVLELQIRW